MNPKLSIIIPLFFAILACQQKPEATSGTTSADTSGVENKNQVPITSCYEGISNLDTFRLSVEVFENKVTGTLAYLFHDKDKNMGDYEGKMYGDTLVADYIFLSEGTSSVRQVAFLLKDTAAKEGYGPMAEKDGKMVFTDLHALSFGKGVIMTKHDCLPVPKEKPTPHDNLTGTWELNYISGSKIAFNGLFPGKKPQLTFNTSAPAEFSGNTSCNSIHGNYKTNDTEIKFLEPMTMTKMYCEGGGEQAFLSMLKKVNIYDVNSTTLTFLVDDVAVMRFSKK